MGEKEWEAGSIFDVIGDTLCRRILEAASRRPVSADELANRLEVSHPTVYRRLNALSEFDLLREHPRIANDGNHYNTYETMLERITIEVDAGDTAVDVFRRGTIVDRFEAFWGDLDAASPEIDVDAAEIPDRDRVRTEGTDG